MVQKRKSRLMGFEEFMQLSEKTEKENTEKAEFFQHLNNVMANKLLKPSIIMEYVNQYNISMGEE
jgi:hypothetical protein